MLFIQHCRALRVNAAPDYVYDAMPRHHSPRIINYVILPSMVLFEFA